MITVTNLTKKKIPKLPWKKTAETILAKSYTLSVVFAENELMRKLNKKYRKKNKVASVLSFPLSKTEGEMFLNAGYSREEMISLFVHSLLHLKGLKHGKKMSEQEKKCLKKINF